MSDVETQTKSSNEEITPITLDEVDGELSHVVLICCCSQLHEKFVPDIFMWFGSKQLGLDC